MGRKQRNMREYVQRQGCSRKGYFYIIDAFVGSAIIFVALFVILGSDVRESMIRPEYTLSEEYSLFILETRIEDLSNPYVNGLVGNGTIKNVKNNIMEQVDRFYYDAYYISGPGAGRTGNMSIATQMLQSVTDPLVPQKYGFRYTIKDSTKGDRVMYERNVTATGAADPTFVIASRKVTFLKIDDSTMFGPETVEIRMWLQ